MVIVWLSSHPRNKFPSIPQPLSPSSLKQLGFGRSLVPFIKTFLGTQSPHLCRFINHIPWFSLIAGRAWDRAPYSWNMVNLFLFGCHVTERTYASTDCTGRVGETIKRNAGVSQACLGKSTSFISDIHNMVN